MKKQVLTFILGAMVSLTISAQGNITEPGASDPNQLYTTTTYDNPSGPNHAPGGPNKIGENGGTSAGDVQGDPGNGPADGSPIGAPWILLGFAVAYAGVRLVKRGRGVEE